MSDRVKSSRFDLQPCQAPIDLHDLGTSVVAVFLEFASKRSLILGQFSMSNSGIASSMADPPSIQRAWVDSKAAASCHPEAQMRASDVASVLQWACVS